MFFSYSKKVQVGEEDPLFREKKGNSFIARDKYISTRSRYSTMFQMWHTNTPSQRSVLVCIIPIRHKLTLLRRHVCVFNYSFTHTQKHTQAHTHRHTHTYVYLIYIWHNSSRLTIDVSLYIEYAIFARTKRLPKAETCRTICSKHTKTFAAIHTQK